MTPDRPKALLFDWDNTLVDTWDIIHHALNTALRAMGHQPWSEAEVRQRVRASARDAFPQLFGARAEEATEIFYAAFRENHLRDLTMRPGAETMLRRLAALPGLTMAVVSNKNGDLLREEARHLKWDGLFFRLVGATDAARDKPDPAAVAAALAGTGLSPGPDVWFVGGTDIDMACAHASGCRAVLIREDPPGPGEFPGHAPHDHFENCLDFEQAVHFLAAD